MRLRIAVAAAGMLRVAAHAARHVAGAAWLPMLVAPLMSLSEAAPPALAETVDVSVPSAPALADPLDPSQLLLPTSELDGTWIVYRPPEGSSNGADGVAVIYLDSLDYDAPRYLSLSAATYDNETLAEAAVYSTAQTEQRAGYRVRQVPGVGDGHAYRGSGQTSDQFSYTLLFRVETAGLVVRVSTPSPLSEEDASAAVDEVAQRVETWVHGVLDSPPPGASAPTAGRAPEPDVDGA